MAEASGYFLPEDQLRERFEERVLDYVFARYRPQVQPGRRPVLVLVGGQQAAGKSQAIARARQRHVDADLVPLTGDALRFLHPRHDEILAEQPWLFLEATSQATRHWMQWSIEHARRERYSLILEGVFRDPAMPLATAQEFAPTHTVEVIGLAVREEVSRLDGEYRFLQGGQWTPPELHDLAYRMMPETIRALAASPAVRRVIITDRSGADLHVLEKTAGTDPEYAVDPDDAGPRAAAAAAAVDDLRARPLPVEEARSWMNRQRDTVTSYGAQGAIDDTSRHTLIRITHADADVILPMADPDPNGQLREGFEAAQPLLRLLVTDALQPTMPIRLQTDIELRAEPSPGQHEQALAELARRAALTPAQRDAEDLVRLQLHPTDPDSADTAGRGDGAGAAENGTDPDTLAALQNLAAQTPKPAMTNPPTAAGEPANPTGPAAQPAKSPRPVDPESAPGLD